MTDSTPHNYTRNILIQMLAVLAVVAAACAWQWEVIYQIYIANQINAVGWVVNGGILILFATGLAELKKRFYEYRNQEQAINRFTTNVNNNEEPLLGIHEGSMVAERFLILKSLNRKRANINQSALAATLLASESSRNSYLKFVHNVLILTGVFGTIISLSMSLLGASDILQSGGVAGGLGGEVPDHASGLGTMIFGMSTALSTTLTAIFAYLFFGYFYIKLTDTQTFLISKIEEVTTTTLMPHLQMNQDAVVRDYTESIHLANELIQKLDKSQKIYADSAQTLEEASRDLAEKLQTVAVASSDNKEMLALVKQVVELHQQTAQTSANNMDQVVSLLQRGFRLPSEDK
jgi:hypothetical protein